MNALCGAVSMYGGYSGYDVQGRFQLIQGTSESAPMFAGVIARLNEVSLALTNRPLGFVNPLLYAMQAATASLPPGQRAFNDIVIGDNVCPRLLVNVTSPALNATVTTANCRSICQGFYAVPGWDPVSHTLTHAFSTALCCLCRACSFSLSLLELWPVCLRR